MNYFHAKPYIEAYILKLESEIFNFSHSKFYPRDLVVTSLINKVIPFMKIKDKKIKFDVIRWINDLLDDLESSNNIDILDTPIAGRYYRFDRKMFTNYVNMKKSDNEIISISNNVPSYFDDIFDLLENEHDLSQSYEKGVKAPASDRLVNLDHNRESSDEIESSLDDILNSIASYLPNNISEPNRDRHIQSIKAASVLWKSTELKLVQIEVSILMVLDDLANVIIDTVKKASIHMLVEAIKKFIRDSF